MKKTIALPLAGALTLTILLSACAGPAGSSPEPTPTPTPAASPSASVEPSAPEQSGPSQETEPAAQTPSEEPAQTSAAENPLKDEAVNCIGQSVSDLIDAIGEPQARDYAPSCLGDGEDGELAYDGFTVYTYREGNTETVTDVL